jgi:tetratricopeptide (TPR) repeat protein
MRGDPSEAVEVWKQTPIAANELILRGEASLAHGEAARALSWFDTALQVQPDSIEALKGRGDAAVGLGRWERARASYARALELDPHTTERYSDYARALIADSYDLPLAEGLLKRAVELGPGSEEVYATLAGLAYARNDHAQALHWWEKAAAVAPTGSVDSLLHLGAAYQAVGQHDKAIAAYQQAVEEVPGSSSVLVELAKAHMAAGNFVEARKAVASALKLDPANSEALRLLEKIDPP